MQYNSVAWASVKCHKTNNESLLVGEIIKKKCSFHSVDNEYTYFIMKLLKYI